LTIKGLTTGATRSEYEYEIPVVHANQMLDNLCEKPPIEKNRFKVPFQGHTWEIDQFLGLNQGLVVAEIELQREDEKFTHPDWLGEEVTDDPRYFNSNLVANPYTNW